MTSFRFFLNKMKNELINLKHLINSGIGHKFIKNYFVEECVRTRIGLLVNRYVLKKRVFFSNKEHIILKLDYLLTAIQKVQYLMYSIQPILCLSKFLCL